MWSNILDMRGHHFFMFTTSTGFATSFSECMHCTDTSILMKENGAVLRGVYNIFVLRIYGSDLKAWTTFHAPLLSQSPKQSMHCFIVDRRILKPSRYY